MYKVDVSKLNVTSTRHTIPQELMDKYFPEIKKAATTKKPRTAKKSS